jgi:hypothetical protein
LCEYIVDATGRLAEVPAFNPIVYTVVYGPDIYYECLRLMLESISVYGNYDGNIKVFSDRSREELLPYIPEKVRGMTSHVPLEDGNWIQRYNSKSLSLETYSPILYLDNDIIIDMEIYALMRQFVSSRKVFVTTEAEIYRDLTAEKISEVSDHRRIGNWWGLELIRADLSCSDKHLPLANSGIMGFSDHTIFELAARLITQLYRSPANADIAKWFTDQPFLNYVLVKTGVGDFEILREKCHFLGPVGDFPQERRGFAHFVWARSEDKLLRMKQYMRHLESQSG